MNSKASGIYSITSKINGKRYIGSANRICDRWRGHMFGLRNGKHENNHLQNHYNKYGENDLLFAVVEVIERGDLSLEDFKKLLLEREQVYLDNWEECHFNSCKIAGSPSGCKHSDRKYYGYDRQVGKFKAYWYINSKRLHFGSYIDEKDAISQVEYIKTLSEEDVITYYEKNFKGKIGTQIGTRLKKTKGYYYNKGSNRWNVVFTVNGTITFYNSFKTEEEARQKAEQIKQELGGYY